MEMLPLSGVIVLDLSHNVAGQFTTKCFSWLGARVLLVEEPTGAATRASGPFFQDRPDTERSLLFAYLNTNKEGVTLDLRKPEGVKLLKELAKKVDVLVEDSAPGEMAKLSLDYAALAQANPRLIMASITNFGQAGPYRDWKATDLTIQAMAGMSVMIGDRDREPLAMAGRQSHYNGSVHAFAGVLAALMQREKTGRGQYIDVSLHDAMAFCEWKGYTYYAADGQLRSRGTESATSDYMLPCRDGYVGFMVNRPEVLEPLAELTGLEELRDPRYATPEGLRRHAGEVKDMLAEWVKDENQEAVYHQAQHLRLPVCYFPTVADLVTSPQYTARKFWTEVEHPVMGKAIYPGAPMKYRDMQFPNRRAPLLGEHTRTAYEELLGYSKRSLTGLKKRGVI